MKKKDKMVKFALAKSKIYFKTLVITTLCTSGIDMVMQISTPLSHPSPRNYPKATQSMKK